MFSDNPESGFTQWVVSIARVNAVKGTEENNEIDCRDANDDEKENRTTAVEPFGKECNGQDPDGNGRYVENLRSGI